MSSGKVHKDSVLNGRMRARNRIGENNSNEEQRIEHVCDELQLQKRSFYKRDWEA